MTETLTIRPATTTDLPAVITLLKECGLPSDDLSADSLSHFHVIEGENGKLEAVAGLDRAGSRGLLRSLAVSPRCRGRGLGEKLVSQCETAALVAGIHEIYLLTTTASGFFVRHGYRELSRKVVPAAIAAHPQFESLCPASATCLGKRL
ncbi:MAG: arsenic resistance N-acetyltransferase ArsN2 [Betaproteobacteria bacterium]